MNIEHLREFIELARLLNFTAAARTMHVSQPALSNHIRLLEKETGVSLVERSLDTGARITPAGQRFLDCASRVVGDIDSTISQMREIQRDVTGRIVIRSPRNEYCIPLLDYIHEFRHAHPNVDVVLSPWIDTDGMADVASGVVDCVYVGYGEVPGYNSGSRDEPTADERSVRFVTYADTEIMLWVDSHDALSSGLGDGQALRGREVIIPANQKRDSWVLGINAVEDRLGISVSICERYCDSLEDLLLDKIQPGDVMLCDANLLKMPALRLRPDRVSVPFDPPLFMPTSLAYMERCDDDDGLALRMFIDFLSREHEDAKRDAPALHPTSHE